MGLSREKQYEWLKSYIEDTIQCIAAEDFTKEEKVVLLQYAIGLAELEILSVNMSKVLDDLSHIS